MTELFHKACKTHGIKAYKLILDVKTRWNSTFAMIQRAIKCRAALDAMAESDAMEKYSLELTATQWRLMEEIAKVLHVFDTATLEMSKAESPTLPHVIPTYNLIMDEIEDYLANEDEERPEACVSAMTAAFVKICEYYKKQEHRAYAIATSK